MILVKPSYEIVSEIEKDKILRIIERAARVCKKSEKYINESSAEKMAKLLLDEHHEAMIEFADLTVKFICDRGVSHEIVRHRLGSYAQESTRYCNYSKDKFNGQVTFIIPEWLNVEEGQYKDGYSSENTNIAAWLNCMLSCEAYYNRLINNGWKAEQARSVLPNSTKTEIIVKYNLREWRHFFKMRCSSAAHPQMREIAIPLLNELKERIPVIFDDINY